MWFNWGNFQQATSHRDLGWNWAPNVPSQVDLTLALHIAQPQTKPKRTWFVVQLGEPPASHKSWCLGVDLAPNVSSQGPSQVDLALDSRTVEPQVNPKLARFVFQLGKTPASPNSLGPQRAKSKAKSNPSGLHLWLNFGNPKPAPRSRLAGAAMPCLCFVSE